MKKTALIIICCLIAMLAQAQTEHMKFMGIPLNGTIDQFQVKLQNKDIRHDVQGSKNLRKGCRLFKGYFAGELADFYVYYNEKSRNVYRAKAVIERNDVEDCKRLLNRFKDMLISKYPSAEGEEGTQDGYPSYSLGLLDNPFSDFKYMGSISLYIGYSMYSYFLHIDYEDYANSRANQQRIMDDL